MVTKKIMKYMKITICLKNKEVEPVKPVQMNIYQVIPIGKT